MIFLAAIAFGPLEPPRQQSFDDGVVRARVTYRIAHDRNNDTGPAAVSPSIAAGSLTLTVGGKTRTIQLSALFPIHDTRIDFSEAPNQGCGVLETFAHRGDYLAVEAIVAEKGCAPIASFIDLETGTVVEDVVLDHSTSHRYDAKPDRFLGTRLVVRRIDRISLCQAPFVIVHAADRSGNLHAFEIDTRPDLTWIPASAMDGLPSIGSTVEVGTVYGHENFDVVRLLEGERLLRLDDTDEGRYAERFAQPSAVEQRLIRRNHWMLEADQDANDGHLDEAISDFATMLTLEDNPDFHASESRMLATCKRMAERMHAGEIDAKSASATFAFGCVRK
jgi:hypothetical protein